MTGRRYRDPPPGSTGSGCPTPPVTVRPAEPRWLEHRARSGSARRWAERHADRHARMVVWCPDWPVTAAAGAAGCPPDTPVAVLDHGRVLASSAAARAEGVRRGLRARDAQSRCPELVGAGLRPGTRQPRLRAAGHRDRGTHARGAGDPARRVRGPGPRAATVLRHRDRGRGQRCSTGSRRTTSRMPGSGVADGPFAAEQAARATSFRQPVQIVPEGESAAFLAPLTVDVLERPELTDLLRRLGLRQLGAFAQLPATEVLTRFGPDGALAHRLAGGLDGRPVVVRRPPPELAREVRAGAGRGPGRPGRVRGPAGSPTRSAPSWPRWGWSAPRSGSRSAPSPAGCTSGSGCIRAGSPRPTWSTGCGGSCRAPPPRPARSPPPVTRVRLVPERVDPVGAHADGLWGGGPDEQIHRALSRVQSMLGHGAVVSVVLGGGREPGRAADPGPVGRPANACPAR